MESSDHDYFLTLEVCLRTHSVGSKEDGTLPYIRHLPLCTPVQQLETIDIIMIK